MKEVSDFMKSPIEGIRIFTDEENLAVIQAEIDGPADTPFYNGVFRLRICFDSDFPSSPPKAWFLSRIFHPNISAKGEVCVNTLKKDWSPELGLKHILLVIRCLLIQPNPESALNEDAGMVLHLLTAAVCILIRHDHLDLALTK